ncbi:hypothetical protein PS925_03838 [Pseudomonas fluorescens]|uniref:Uncharacterized protein n=1 Tax=Pseudomonas fluorescens TaxID=294 RepID=A0A5E7UWU7_PSEFL|nr:hypothetical protein [Pseudomonas fluorescens]VVQ13938.1 hypothetical protein PS925_03838 [Pseudomonas fluorescens]
MINQIANDEKCFQICAGTLEEEGIKIAFGTSITDADGNINEEKVAILKPDHFYNTRDFATPPKSVDGVVVIDHNSDIHLYVAELKSSCRLQNICKKDIQEKFSTIFENFFSADFKHIFLDIDYSLKAMSLWLICDPTNIRSSLDNPTQLAKKMKAASTLRGMLADYAASLKPYTFKGITTPIQLLISPPTIEQDHFTDFLTNAEENLQESSINPA